MPRNYLPAAPMRRLLPLAQFMAEPFIVTPGVHRPRNVDWKRAAALLYGDWGTSKAYVIGLAFLAAGFSSLPIILAVCAVTALVGVNYIVVCRHFPDGGGVYSAARSQGRLLAVVGALLLLADLTVTAALSGWSGLSYITSGAEQVVWIKVLRDHIGLTTVAMLFFIGWLNYFGPKHSGSLAVLLAVPTALVVVVLIGISVPHLTTAFLQPPHQHFWTLWVQFVGVILALSGAESIANLTGVMKLDPGSTMDHPKVSAHVAESDPAGGDRGSRWHGAFSAGRCFRFPAFFRQTLHLATGAPDGRRNGGAERGHAALYGRAIRRCDRLALVRGSLRLDRGHRLFLPPRERGEHRDRRHDRPPFYDGARWRNAAPIHEAEQARGPDLPASHCGWHSVTGLAHSDRLHCTGRALRDRGGRSDRGECRLVRL